MPFKMHWQFVHLQPILKCKLLPDGIMYKSATPLKLHKVLLPGT